MALERVEALLEQLRRHMVQQGGELRAPVPARRFPHASQAEPRIAPALGPGCGLRRRVSLSRSPSLHRLRERVVLALVRRLPGYYAIVRLPTGVHVGRLVDDLPRPIRSAFGGGCPWDLPFPARGVSAHAQGLRPRGTRSRLALNAWFDIAFRFA